MAKECLQLISGRRHKVLTSFALYSPDFPFKVKGILNKTGTPVDKLVIVIANLMPREMKFGTSDGMMLATQNNGEIILLRPEKNVLPGAKVS